MFDFEVAASQGAYRVLSCDRLEEAIAAEVREGDIVLLDRRVADLHADRLGSLLSAPRHLILDASEELKSYRGVGPVIEHLTESGFRKSDRLIGIGGGIVQDVTGFVASILFRGVDWIFFPTTLLSQCDSCIGSKTSINVGIFKNQLGNFYPPSAVHIDPLFLDSLAERELLSGLGEMAHYFLVASEDDFVRFAEDAPRALENPDILRDLIERSLQIKRGFIEVDELDRNERQVLNYGHSFGHAIETLVDYRIPHGIAVSYGIDLANFVSAKMGLMTMEQRDRIRPVLSRIWTKFPIGKVVIDDYLAALGRDKKNVGSTLGLILTRGPGHMFKKQVEVTDAFRSWLVEYFGEEEVRV